MPNPLQQRITEFTDWREKLVAAIDEFRSWQDTYGQADIEQTLRISREEMTAVMQHLADVKTVTPEMATRSKYRRGGTP